MASLVLGIAGAAALGPAGLAWGGALGMSGAQIGFTVGSMIGNMMTKLPDVQGPRLGDLKVQSSTYGKSIPIYYGTSRGAGEVMWSSDLIETENEEEAGNKGGPSQSVTSYTYSVNCAVAVCVGEITGIRRMWANGNLIYDQSAGNLGPTGQNGNIRVYTGSETQVADSLLEAYLGAGNVPAHRGLAYVVFENLQLEKYGNRIPNFSFEVVANGDIVNADPVPLVANPEITMNHPFIDGLLITITKENGLYQPAVMHLTDLISKADRSFNISNIEAQYCNFRMTYVDFFDPLTGVMLNEIWVSYGFGAIVAIALDAATLTFVRNIEPAYAGFAAVGNMHYDKKMRKVMFATSSSTIFDGYNFLDPVTLIWEGYQEVPVIWNWFTGRGIAGNNSIALSTLYNEVCIFENLTLKKLVTTSLTNRSIAYDTLRERYVWFDRIVSSKMVFKTINDDFGNEVNEFFPVTTVEPESTFRALHYFPIADKFFFTDTYTLYKLNAETFETEQSWRLNDPPDAILEPREITSLEEYIALTYSSFVGGGGVKLVPLTDRLASNTVVLSSIVTDICGRVDLTPSDIDVIDLTDEVEGYTIAQQMTARAAIDGLQAAFYFDAVESD